MRRQELTTENPLAALPGPLLAWYRANARDLPWRHTLDPYRIWVSEIMLQQTLGLVKADVLFRDAHQGLHFVDLHRFTPSLGVSYTFQKGEGQEVFEKNKRRGGNRPHLMV